MPSLDSPTKKPADEHLKEFMQVMQPRTKKGPSWANEEPLALLPVSSVTNPVDDDLVSKSRTRVKGDVEVEDFGDVEGEQKDAGISDLDWLKQRTKPVLDYTNVEGEKVFEQSDDDESDAKDGNAEVVCHPPYTTERLSYLSMSWFRYRTRLRKIRPKSQSSRHHDYSSVILPLLVPKRIYDNYSLPLAKSHRWVEIILYAWSAFAPSGLIV